jgi:hypothetical protein
LAQKAVMRAVNAIFAALTLVLAAVGPVAAGEFEDAGAAFDRGDYATAVRLFRPLADQGDAAAQQRLGLMYEGGLGVPEDYAVAAMWFRRAAGQGLKTAQWDLGLMYETGSGVQQTYVQAQNGQYEMQKSEHPANLRDSVTSSTQIRFSAHT